MKKLIFLITIIAAITAQTFAQTEEQRNNKLQLTITHAGKTITTELNSVSTSISRYQDDEEPHDIKPASKDTSKNKMPSIITGRGQGGTFYLTMEAKKIGADMLNVFAKRKTRFDGTITITDLSGKTPVKTIKFKQGALYNYSDQFSTVSYSDAYGSVVLSITCKELSIDGINIEQ